LLKKGKRIKMKNNIEKKEYLIKKTNKQARNYFIEETIQNSHMKERQ
jgi:hypothetical protein